MIPAFSSNLATGGTSPQAIQTVDLDRDSDLDLAVVNFSSDKVGILLNDGKGQFTDPITHRTQGRLPVTVHFGLFSDDLDLDMVVLTDGGGALELFRGSGDGNFGDSVLIAGGLLAGSSESSLTLADLDGDRIAELAVVERINRVNQDDAVGIYAATGTIGAATPEELNCPVSDRSSCE